MFRSLYNNQLSGTIPSSIGNLTQLQDLYVHSCFQFYQQTHSKLTLSTQTFLFLCVWFCSDNFPWINWVERSLHRSAILSNFSSCMFFLAFNTANKGTSILTLSIHLLYLVSNLCSDIFPWINWVERFLHRSVILSNLSNCMLIFLSIPTAKLHHY